MSVEEEDFDSLKSIRQEIDSIQVAAASSRSRNPSVVESEEQLAQTQIVLDQLAESENLIHELSEPWEAKLKRSEELRLYIIKNFLFCFQIFCSDVKECRF